MSYREVSEVRDGMRIDWDMPITMDDGLVLRCDVFRPIKKGRYPVILSHGPYGKWLHFEDGYKTAWNRMEREAPERDGGLDQQVPELGSLRPGEVGAGRLRLRARRFARLRPFARLRGALVAARDQGLLRLHRMGGRAAVVERQGRLERHLLLRHQPVAGREPAAEASRRHLRLGGLRRLLSRAQPQRRHLQHLRAELVRHAGQDRAVRARHQGPSQPHERRLGVGPGDAHRRKRWAPTATISARPISRIRSTTTTTRRCCRTGRRSRCRCCRPPTGAGSRCTRAAISKASSARRRNRNGSRCTASSIGRIITPTTASTCRRSSSAISSRARRTAGTSSRACSSTSVIRARSSSSATRTTGRSRARSGPSSISPPTARS